MKSLHKIPVLVQKRSESNIEGVKQNSLDEFKAEDVPKPPHSTFLQYEIPSFLGNDHERQNEINQQSEDQIRVMPLSELAEKCRRGDGFTDYQKTGLLDQLFPPVDVRLNNKKWRFYVSKTPARALDRLELFNQFEKKSKKLNVHERDYCIVDSVQNLFDECIRQEILACSERGLILSHCRNGFNRIIQTYVSLTGSVQMNTMQTCTTLGLTVNNLQKRLDQDEMEIRRLEYEVKQVNDKVLTLSQHYAEERKNTITKYHDQLEFLKRMCQQCHNQIEQFENVNKDHVAEERKKEEPKKTHMFDVVHKVIKSELSKQIISIKNVVK